MSESSYIKRHHKAISVRFDEDEYNHLKEIADFEERPLHVIIKRAIRKYLDSVERAPF